MKMSLKLLTLLTITGLLLSACGSAATSTEESTYPASTEPSAIGTLPESTAETTEPAMTPETTPEVTVEATLPSTGTLASPTQMITGTAVIPPTGFVDPGRATSLLDFQVFSKDNAQIGDVEDLVLDADAMTVSYVVVKTGQDGKLIPVPWSALTVVTAQSQPTSTLQTPASKGSQNGLMLNVDQSSLDKAPTIDLTTIPGLGEAAAGWDSDYSTYWNGVLGTSQSGTPAPTTTSPTTTGLQGVVLATKLLDYKLSVGQGLPTAKVGDVIIDVKTGAIQYVVISISSEAGGEKMIPIPLSLFSWDKVNQTFGLTVSPDMLLKAPSFAGSEFPHTQQPDWDALFREFWKQAMPATTP